MNRKHSFAAWFISPVAGLPRAFWRGRRSLLVLGVLLGVAVLMAPEARAGGLNSRKTGAGAKKVPVTITGINAKEGVVTAKDTAGNAFQFPANAAALKTLKVGQKVDTKFIRNAVRLGGAQLPHCECGKMADGTCWCSKCPGDACFKIGCPYGDCRSTKPGQDKPVFEGPSGRPPGGSGASIRLPMRLFWSRVWNEDEHVQACKPQEVER